MSESVVSSYYFNQGERKYISSRIVPTDNNEEIIISSAYYELTRVSDGNVEDSGEIKVSGRDLKILISPLLSGKYLLTETVSVGEELYKRVIPVIVS